jgi:AcrR family transcriptional regulator
MAQSRRNPVELRALLLKAAEQVFAREGYVAATTKDLAREAGVSESVMFRHFPSKAALFRESVLDPLLSVLSAFSDASARYLAQPLDDTSLMRLVMSELLDQLSVHRAALRSFTAAEDDLEPAARADFHRAIDEVLAQMGAVARAEGERRGRGNTGLGVEMTTRLAVGLIISLVVHDEWLLPIGEGRPSRSDLVDHLTAFMLEGVGAAIA